MKPTRNLFARLLSLSAITLLGSHSAQADNAFWDGTGTDWSLGASWSTVSGATTPNPTNAKVPGTGDTATFNATTGNTTVTTTAVTINTILFDGAGVLAYTLGASAGTGQITLNDSGAITISSAVVNNQLINASVVLGTNRSTASYSFTNNSTTSGLTFAGAISGGASGGSQGDKVLIIAGSGNTLISGLISNGGATSVGLTKTGLGVIRLSNASSSYTGATTIIGGTLEVGANAPSGGVGALGNTTSAVILGNASTAAGDAPSLLISGAFTVARAISVGSGATTAYNATIGGSNTTLTSTYSGAITLSSAASYTTTLRAATGGTVDFTGAWTTNNKAIAIGSSGNTGTVKLSNTLATSGGVSVNFGTFLLGASDRLGDTTPVTVAGGIFDTGSFSDSVGAVSLTSGSITGSGGTLTGSSYAVESGSIGAKLGGSGIALTKTTSGTVSLSAANTYTGATTIKAGTLELLAGGSLASTSIIVGDAGSTGAILDALASAMIVKSGQTVSGIGTIKGSTTIQSGGTLAPGNSAGILTNLGNITLDAGSSFVVEIGGVTAGTGYDQLNVTGGSSIVTLAGLLNVTTTSSPTNGSLFFLIDNDGSSAISGVFSNAPINGNTYTFGSQQYAVSYFGDYAATSFTGGNDVVLMAVPEPGAALLGGLGVLCLLRRRRSA